MDKELTIRVAQELVWKNKVAKGWEGTDVPTEFCYLMGELGEAFEAWRTKSDGLAEELADIVIYVLGLATKSDVDLQEAVARKIEKNARRVYRHDPEIDSHVRVYDGE